MASCDQVGDAFACGCTGFTHLFNAMSGMHHREPGVAAWALAHGEHAEIICDLYHVHRDVILAARRSIQKLYAVTDATAAVGMLDGKYMLGDRMVLKHGGKVTLEDGEPLAGSVITKLCAIWCRRHGFADGAERRHPDASANREAMIVGVKIKEALARSTRRG
jgi:N-acetylglucosamine-6-phosphate deacetylase